MSKRIISSLLMSGNNSSTLIAELMFFLMTIFFLLFKINTILTHNIIVLPHFELFPNLNCVVYIFWLVFIYLFIFGKLSVRFSDFFSYMSHLFISIDLSFPCMKGP
jgi:hypothetical protein